MNLKLISISAIFILGLTVTAGVPAIAIVDVFDQGAQKITDDSKKVTSMALAALSKYKGFYLVKNSELNDLNKNPKAVIKAFGDKLDAREVGRKLRANYIVLGMVFLKNGNPALRCHIIDCDNSRRTAFLTVLPAKTAKEKVLSRFAKVIVAEMKTRFKAPKEDKFKKFKNRMKK